MGLLPWGGELSSRAVPMSFIMPISCRVCFHSLYLVPSLVSTGRCACILVSSWRVGGYFSCGVCMALRVGSTRLTGASCVCSKWLGGGAAVRTTRLGGAVGFGSMGRFGARYDTSTRGVGSCGDRTSGHWGSWGRCPNLFPDGNRGVFDRLAMGLSSGPQPVVQDRCLSLLILMHV